MTSHVPPTVRLYYTDAVRRTFEATVLGCEADQARWRVLLDRTAFYPTSGGQPYDTGHLGGADVLAVADGPAGEIVHVTTGPLEAGSRVEGEIDWTRRFDHMQQHTGQHVLSAVCAARLDVATVGFHLGGDASTIDLEREVGPGDFGDVEREANRIIWENRPVRVRFVSAADAERLPLRKPPARTGEIRLVEIDDCDLSACGGTHVPATGMIGQIAIVGSERVRGATRVTFVCGGRALRSHTGLRDIVQSVGAVLSVAPNGLPGAVERLQREAGRLGRTVGALEEELAGLRAAAWRETAETVGRYRVVLRRVDEAAETTRLKSLAAAVTGAPGLVAVLAGGNGPCTLVVTRSADVALDAAAIVREVVAALGGRGGGRPDQAQAGLAAPADQVILAVRAQLSRR